MEAKTKQYLLVTVIGVSLFAALMNLPVVLAFSGKIISLILPVIVGAILALFINVSLSGIEKRLKRLFDKGRKKPSDKQLHIISFILTILCILFVLTLVLTLLVPEIVHSSQRLYIQLEAKIPEWLVYLESHNVNARWLEELSADIDLEHIMQNISGNIDSFLMNIANVLSSTISNVIMAAFSIVISIYMTLGKERVCRHARKLISAYMKPAWAEKLFHISQTFSKSFAKFLSGQCSEAVILGTLMFLAFTIFKLPYGSLVGVLTAVCAIIPYVGAFISGAVSVILTLLIDPALALRCLIVYLVVQFIENQFIYPRVVGGSVGLPPLYTLISAMIGGKLFGIMGIIFFIPLMAATIELVKEDVQNRLYRNKIVLLHRGNSDNERE